MNSSAITASADALPSPGVDKLPLLLRLPALALLALPVRRLRCRPGSPSPSPAWRWA